MAKGAFVSVNGPGPRATVPAPRRTIADGGWDERNTLRSNAVVTGTDAFRLEQAFEDGRSVRDLRESPEVGARATRRRHAHEDAVHMFVHVLIAAQTRSAGASFETSSTSASGIDTATRDPTPKFATASLTSRAPYVSSLTRATPSPLRRRRVLGGSWPPSP